MKRLFIQRFLISLIFTAPLSAADPGRSRRAADISYLFIITQPFSILNLHRLCYNESTF